MRTLQSAGTFRGKPTGWQVKQIPSGSVAITVEFEVGSQKEGDNWKAITPAFVKGDFFVAKQTGAPNEKVVAMLGRYLGWGGTFAEITETPPLDAVVEVDVEEKPWKDRTFFEVRWIRQPGEAAKAATPAALDYGAAKSLDQKFGAAFAKVAKKAKAEATKAEPPQDFGDIPF